MRDSGGAGLVCGWSPAKAGGSLRTLQWAPRNTKAAFSAVLPGGAVVHPAQTVVAAGARAFVSLEWQAARQRVHAPAPGRNLWQSPVPGQRVQHVHYYLAL